MRRQSDQAPSRTLERIDAICRSAPDAMILRSEILGELRGLFDFDAFVWLLTDPVTTVGCSPFADVPVVDELPRLIRLKYLTDINRWTRLASEGRPSRSLLEASAGHPEVSRGWLEMLRDHRVVDVASTVFADRLGCWGFLDLWRLGSQTAFEARVMTVLSAVAAPIATALRRCQAATFATPSVTPAGDLGPMVLVLDAELHVRSQTAASEAWLRVLVPPPPGRAPIPASAYNVGAQLLANEEKVDAHPARTRVHLADGFWVTVRAARLGGEGDDTGAGGADVPARIAVTIEGSSPMDRMEMYALAHGLTPRERELVTLLGTGVGTSELAGRLFVSEHTVQDHLKAIFSRTQVHSRRELLARALGVTEPPTRASDP